MLTPFATSAHMEGIVNLKNWDGWQGVLDTTLCDKVYQ
jgi:hypothetical protein